MAITKTNITTAATLVAAAAKREWGALRNISDEDIFVSLEGSADVTTDAGAKPGLKIPAGKSLTFGGETGEPRSFVQAIYAIHGGSGSKVLVFQTL